jgi:ABC-type lipoprotein export system ATPase subunit
MTHAPLEMRDVSIHYDRAGSEPLAIVDGYDLTLERGTIHVLAGRSGSGKTSILRVAAGLVVPTSGTVVWEGEQITGRSDDATTLRRRSLIGYLDQGGVLVPGLTALENVLLPAVPDRQTRQLASTAAELLDRLGVSNQSASYPDKLSGGERQRVAFARALLLAPSIVMADEPTASLDRVTADGIIELLRELANFGIAVLVAAHDQRLIDSADSWTVLA